MSAFGILLFFFGGWVWMEPERFGLWLSRVRWGWKAGNRHEVEKRRELMMRQTARWWRKSKDQPND